MAYLVLARKHRPTSFDDIVGQEQRDGTLEIDHAGETFNLETGTTSVAVGLTLTNGTLVVPYNAHGSLSVHTLQEDGECKITHRRLSHGAIVTDSLVTELAGVEAEAIDLEHDIYQLHVEDMPVIQRYGATRNSQSLARPVSPWSSPAF